MLHSPQEAPTQYGLVGGGEREKKAPLGLTEIIVYYSDMV